MKKHSLLPDVARGKSEIYKRSWLTRSLIVAALLVCLVPLARPTATQSATAATSQANEWTRLSTAPVIEVAIDPTNPNIIYAGSDIGDVFKTTDGGATWTSRQIVAHGTVTSLAIDFVNPNNVYAGTLASEFKSSAGVFKSIDGGATWNFLNVAGRSILMDPQSPNTLFAFGSFPPNLWRTTDSGSSWSVLQTGSLSFYGYGSAISLSDPQTLYALGSDNVDSQVHKSTDGGASWSPVGKGLNGFKISDIAVDPVNPNIFVAGDHHAFKSTDGGANWLNISEGLVLNWYTEITSIAISPTDPNSLYVGTFSYEISDAVFHSPNGGACWSEFSHGLYPSINELAMDSSGTSLYAATFGGVFRYQLAPTPTCTGQISPTCQFFSSIGGAGSVTVTAPDDCRWIAESDADWLRVSSTSSGSAMLNYTIALNDSTASRTGRLSIGGRVLKVTQAGLPIRILRASAAGKKLFVEGENFDPGAVILLNYQRQATRNDPQNPRASLIGKPAGKKIKPGDRLQVRNPNGSFSDEFIYTAGS